MSRTLHDNLASLDLNSLDLYERLSEDPEALAEHHKAIGWLLPQWMTASPTPASHKALVLMFDELCNPGWYELSNHPMLQTKLLALIGLGKRTQHKFFSRGGRASATPELVAFLQLEYPDIRADEVSLFCRDSTLDDLHDLLYHHGIAVDKHAAIVKQYQKVKTGK